MRIVVVRRVPGSTPSIDIYADNLVAGLRTVRPEWTIIEVEPKPWNDPDKLWLSGPGFKKYYECFWRYPKAVKKQQADIFHIVDQTDGHITTWLKRSGQSVVVTCHDLVHFIYPEILRTQSRLSSLSYALWKYSVQGMRSADQVVAVSSNTAEDVQHWLGLREDKVSVVFNGIGPEFRVLPSKILEHFRQQHAVLPSTICLLNVGGSDYRKNISTVLEVVHHLKIQGLSVCLWKVGADFATPDKAFIREHNLEQQVIHFGRPDKEMLVTIYNAADVLLSPSLYEGFGFTIAESMACGTPVITSNVSSLPEVGGDAVILVEPKDTEAIVQAIRRLKEDVNYRSQLIDKGLTRRYLFDWNKSAEKIATIYEKTVRERKEATLLHPDSLVI